MSDPVRSQVLGLYTDEPLGTRLHTHLRWRTCPFAALSAHLPPAGRVLDYGCGHGLLSFALASASPDRSVLGVDVDRAKIAVAARRNPFAATRFMTTDDDWREQGPFDAVVVADVLYLLGSSERERLLDDLTAVLAPGGVLAIKEISKTPRWKYGLCVVQELISTRVTRITEGDEVDFLAPEDLADALVDRGLGVEHHRLDAGHLAPHHLVLARR